MDDALQQQVHQSVKRLTRKGATLSGVCGSGSLAKHVEPCGRAYGSVVTRVGHLELQKATSGKYLKESQIKNPTH